MRRLSQPGSADQEASEKALAGSMVQLHVTGPDDFPFLQMSLKPKQTHMLVLLQVEVMTQCICDHSTDLDLCYGAGSAVIKAQGFPILVYCITI